MKIERIELRGVTVHVDTVVELPARGTVVITGPNGQGKSTLAEAVPLVAWGRGVRRTSMWAADSGGEAAMVADGVRYVRKKTKSRTTLTVDDGGTGDTATKSQPFADARLPPFDAWRRACHFSATAASSFCQASPGDRLKLLEAMAAMDLSDALKSVRERARDAGERQREASARAGVLRQRSTDWQAIASRRLIGLPEPAPHDVPRAEALALAAARELASAELLVRDAADARATADAEVREASARAAAGALRGECPKCLQEVHADHAASVAAEAAQRLAAGQAAQSTAHEAQRRARAARDEALTRRRELDAEVTRQREIRARSQVAQEERARAEAEAAEARDQAAALAIEAAAAEAEAAIWKPKEANLRGAEQVLGPRGFRVAALADVVAALEEFASQWVPRLLPGASVAMPMDGACDSLDLEIRGVARDLGYDALSAGQQRRVSVAMTMALAQVASASAGWGASTMFFDEVFEFLDAAGVAAVIDVLEELSATRCVVIITPNEALAGFGDVRLRVDGGKVRRC